MPDNTSSYPSVLLTGTGSYLPEKFLTNDDLSSMMDTSDQWIRERTGIKKRHIAADGELTSDLAVAAATEALLSAGLTPEDIDGIIVATTTPDDTFPSTASTVQYKLGASKAFAFDIQSVCAGFVYGLDVGESMIKAGKANRMLIIGAETFSRILDWTDRSTAVLFGDGAGAVILEGTPYQEGWGILSSVLFTDGRYRDILYVDGGPSRGAHVGTVKMKGQDLFKHAVEKLSSSLNKAIDASGLSIDQIDWLVPHQANMRIINQLHKRLNISDEKVILTVSSHANTSAASIPLALNDAVSRGVIKSGHVVAFEAIGGGLSWGASVARIGKPE